MKKCLAILSIIFFISFICSAVLAGKVYYQDIKTYVDEKNEVLDINALDRIYIKSSTQVDIYPTTGNPYVEFKQDFVDLVGVAPKYDLKVEKKDKSTYISLEQTDDVMVSLGIKKNEAKLSVYLPQKQIEQLSVENTTNFYNSIESQVIDLQGIDIKKLDVDLLHAEISLDGKYEDVKLSVSGGKLDMKSKQPVQLYTNGNIDEVLSGKFENITIDGEGCYVNIDSEEACNVQIDSYNSKFYLKGNYKSLNLSGEDNNIDLHSETPCKVLTKGKNNVIVGNGAFEEMDLKEMNSEIEIKTTMIPEKIQMKGCTGGTSIKLTLPSNIPGFNVHCVREDYLSSFDEEELMDEELAEEQLVDPESIKSEFILERYVSEKGELNYSYGDKSIPMTLTRKNDISLEIIEGDYSSIQ